MKYFVFAGIDYRGRRLSSIITVTYNDERGFIKRDVWEKGDEN